jgi:hypothetical protein
MPQELWLSIACMFERMHQFYSFSQVQNLAHLMDLQQQFRQAVTAFVHVFLARRKS